MYPNNPPTAPEQPSVPPAQPMTPPEYAPQAQPYGPQQPQYAQPQPLPQQQYAAPQPPVPQQVQAGDDPGKVMNIVGLVLAFIFPFAGLPLSIIGYKKSKKAGANTALGIIGIILNSVFLGVSLFGLLLTTVAFNGVKDRAMTSDGAVAAHEVAKAAEVYNMETADFSVEEPIPRYPQSFSGLSFTSERPVLAAVPMTKAPSEPKTVEFYACGNQTGNKIGYWDYTQRMVRYEYTGSASADSQDCTLITQ